MNNDENDQPREDALRALFQKNEENLLRYAFSMCRNRVVAEDAVQETFLRLCRSDWASIEGKAVPWLFRVCRSRLLDHFRKEGRMSALEGQAEAVDVSHRHPAKVLEQQEKSAQVLSLVDELPHKQREVVRLRFQSQLSYQEIADVTELSVSNVGFLLHSALQSLRSQV